MSAARYLRMATWVVVAAAIVDPEVSLRSRPLPRVRVLSEVSREATDRIAARLGDAVAGIAVLDQSGEAPPDAFVLIAERYPFTRLPEGAPVHVISTAALDRPGLSISRAEIPAATVMGLPVGVTVGVQRTSNAAARTPIQLLDGGVVVSDGEIQWGDGQRAATATLTYVPTRVGPIRLAIRAGPAIADVLTEVRDERFDVAIDAGSASWGLTFLAAALKDDDRLDVSTRIATTRGRVVESRTSSSDGARPPVSFVGPNLAAALEPVRRAAAAGATIVLVPDRQVPESVGRLAGIGRLRDHVSSTPLKATNGLRAGEWLLSTDLNPAARLHASVRVGDRDYPVAVETPVGQGRVVLVTALDAWRYRADSAYASFWRGLTVELAATAKTRQQRLHVQPGVARPDDPVIVTMDADLPGVNTLPARIVSAGNVVSTFTLVKIGIARLAGRVDAPRVEGRYDVSAADGSGVIATVPLLVARDAQPLQPVADRALRALAHGHGGVLATPDRLDDLADAIRNVPPRVAERDRVRPMRWPGWAGVIALMLGAEWWIRRRNGLR